MRISIALALGILASAFAPAQTEAQVSATIAIGDAPLRALIRIGHPQVRVIGLRSRPRVIFLEPRAHLRRGHYRRAVVYYDRRSHRYYDRFLPGLIEVRVFQQGGRYYWRNDRDRDGQRFRGDDRQDRRDDRWNRGDDRQDRRDDRWNRGDDRRDRGNDRVNRRDDRRDRNRRPGRGN